MYIQRTIEAKIKENLFKSKVIILYGARQVGKTTTVQKILDDFPRIKNRYFNADELDVQRLFTEVKSSANLKEIIGDTPLIIIDEAQRIENIGLKLKMLVDNFPKQQIIATGSSSFELARGISEPLTGRHIQFWLHPLSFPEITQDKDQLQINRLLEPLLIYGSYPEVITAPSSEKKKMIINGISSDYLYKDILAYQSLRNPTAIRKLLEALALQIGNEVSYNELASLVGISKETVASYIDILEKAFIVFRLRPFSRNLRKELGKLTKIYFFDLGIRNSLINNQNSLSLRSDRGALWENFIINEFKKRENYIGNLKRLYFWRTYEGAEIDLIEERGGQLFAWEVKWDKEKKNPPKSWRENYPQAIWQVINQHNYLTVLKTTS